MGGISCVLRIPVTERCPRPRAPPLLREVRAPATACILYTRQDGRTPRPTQDPRQRFGSLTVEVWTPAEENLTVGGTLAVGSEGPRTEVD